ncbi:MAG: nitroreductase family protein [Deltaproteobacteria bacterium]|nr:nitroreductase family protein [Deltaproteobacteria bacterium]
MELIEGIQQRKSIRAFLDKPVPKDVIKEILSIACRAPSAMNTQPWEFVVVSGEKLNRLRAAIVENLKKGTPIVPDHLVVGWPNEGVYKDRQVTLAKQLFKAMDIPREDKEKRAWWLERGFRFFDAPAAIIIATDKVLGEAGPLLDLGAVMQNICLAALHFNLGICIEDQGVLYPDVVREHTGIPQNKRLMIAIALGYPDPDFPANQIRAEREPAENLTTWVE